MSVTVLDYLRVLIWPAVVCVLAFAFRAAIRSVLRVRLSHLDAAGISMRFEQVAEQARELVSPAPKPTSSKKSASSEWPTGSARFSWAGYEPARAVVDPETGVARITPLFYAEARTIAQTYRDDKRSVIIDLTEMPDSQAVRLIDFSAGLIFQARGSIIRLDSKVYLLQHPDAPPPDPAPVVAGRRS